VGGERDDLLEQSTDHIMRVAVVGLGYWGPNLVRNLYSVDACTEVVVCDTDESRVKSIKGTYPATQGTGKYDEVLADPEITAVVIATPVATHADLATSALDAGKSVLVEKPLAASARDASRLIDLARENRVLVMAGHTFLYSPPVRTVSRLLHEGKVGVPLYVQSSRVNLGIHQSDVSVLWDLAPHDLSILFEWLQEEPVQVSALGRTSFGGSPDVAFMHLSFPSGCIANLHLSWLAPTKMRRTTLVGTRRMVVYEDTNPEEPVKVYDKGVNDPDPQNFLEYKMTYRTGAVVSPFVESVEPLRAELEDFLARVSRHELPGRQEEAAAAVVATIEKAERSLQDSGALQSL
jgi:predicted dehydrogenase